MVTVLCVDDDRSLNELIRYALEREGFRVLVAQTAAHGWALLRTEPIDLVLLDLTLPDLSGQDFLAQLRAISKVPVIVLSGRAAELAAGLHAGADDYVTKPFAPPILLAHIRAALRRCATDRLADQAERSNGIA